MRDLLERESVDTRAAESDQSLLLSGGEVHRRVRRSVGRLDLLVFTGGIGERAAPRPAPHLQTAGVSWARARPGPESVPRPVVSTARASQVRVIKTNEELMIARHACRFAN
jgi:acetate kinase